MTVEELIKKIGKLSRFDRKTLLVKKFQDEDLIQNRKLLLKIPDSLLPTANFEYAIRIATQVTFDFDKFDNKSCLFFEIAD